MLVGDNPASQIYVRNKRKTTDGVGMRSFAHDLPSTTTQAELLALIDVLNADPAVNGILVQLPLPRAHRRAPCSSASTRSRTSTASIPTTSAASCEAPAAAALHAARLHALLKETGELVGKHAVVVGRSEHRRQADGVELLIERCTVTICHSRTRDLPRARARRPTSSSRRRQAEVRQGDLIKPGAIVIDVGINRTDDGKLCGDVDFAAAKESARA